MKLSRKNIFFSVIIVFTFLISLNLKYFNAFLIFGRENYNSLPLYTKLLITQVPGLLLCLLVAFLLCRKSGIGFLDTMGLNKNIKEALLIALLCCSPMLIGYHFITHGTLVTEIKSLFWASVWPGINEEIVFRAFLFGLLIRLCKWNFWVALLFPGMLFALGHLYQAESAIESLQIFAFTTLAGAGFSLFYIGWKWNIWFPLFMHIFMNFAWAFYNIHENVLGNTQANVLRFVTIGLGIYYTLKKMKENNISWKNLLET